MQRGFLLERNSTPAGVQKNKQKSDNTKKGSRPSTPPGDSSIADEAGIPTPPNTRKRQATSPAQEASARAADRQISELQERLTVMEELFTQQGEEYYSMFMSILSTLSDWEEEGMVEDILEKVDRHDNGVSGLPNELRAWHVKNLQWRKSLRDAAKPTKPTTEAPQVPDTTTGNNPERKCPSPPVGWSTVAQAADAQAPTKEPEDVEMVVDPPKQSFAAVVAHPPTKKPLSNRGQQRTSVRQNSPANRTLDSPLKLHQVWIKGVAPERISNLKRKLFNDHFILSEIHDITYFPRQVTRFTISQKYYHRFLRQCEAMRWVVQAAPGQRNRSAIPALSTAPPRAQEKRVDSDSGPEGQTSKQHQVLDWSSASSATGSALSIA
ncbi:hypothetical protein IW136_003003 [Coemansia sp. RSA 678]|nr:hypothetical protein IW136_003003 [Coemansia sp. RSA 678]